MQHTFALLIAALLSAGLTLAPSTAHAHHSFAMYDSTKLLQVVGTVKEFQWTNPHVILWLVEDGAAGAEGPLWTIELPTSTGNLARMDWTKHSLVPGDRVTVELNPLRDGRHGGSFKKVTIAATGKVLKASAPAPPDAGVDSAQSSAAPQPSAANTQDAQAKPTQRSGCECAPAGAAVPAPWLAWALALWAVLRLRRRHVRGSSPAAQT